MGTEDSSLDRIAAEASEWFIAIRTGELSVLERERFSQWLTASPVHIEEYLGLAEVWEGVKVAGLSVASSADELIAATRGDSNVVALRSGVNQERSGIGRNRVVLAAGILIAAVIVVPMLALFWSLRTSTYATELGEQRSISLEDGSVIQLNTLSKVSVRFDENARTVEMQDGEAYFRIAHDPSRPFLVVTDLGTVRVVGTQFNIYNRDSRMRVVVMDGRVQLSAKVPSPMEDLRSNSSPPREAPISLHKNESAEIRPNGSVVRSEGKSSEATLAWMHRRLSFEAERLDAVVAEFNRYSRTKMVLDGSALSDLRISGVFDVDDPDTLVDYLEQIHAARVERGHSIVTISDVGSGSAP